MAAYASKILDLQQSRITLANKFGSQIHCSGRIADLEDRKRKTYETDKHNVNLTTYIATALPFS